jgi:hypothetical protein
MTYIPSPLVEHAWAKPPRCLSAFVATAVHEPQGFTDLHDELAVFRLSCRCGASCWYILGHEHKQAGFVCPLSLECSACGSACELFDVDKHGYDAEFGEGGYSIRGTGVAERYKCASCHGESFDVLASFSYQIEPIEDLEEEAIARIEDYFDVFGLDGKCTGCSRMQNVSGYECA